MARQRIVCSGWIEDKGEIHHPCGIVMGFKQAKHPGDTHSMCSECMTEYLKSHGYTLERIKEIVHVPTY